MKTLSKIFQCLYTAHYTGKFHRATIHRVKMLDTAIKYIRDESISGSYFEFGVARGLTFIAAYHIAKRNKSPLKRFYALDSFQGLPKPEGVDRELERFKEGAENWSLQLFKSNLKKSKINMEDIVIYEGWFKDTWTKEEVNKIYEAGDVLSIGWVDCDMYQSVKDVLNNIYPLLQQGSVLIFDDWYCYKSDPTKGEQRAAAEFLQDYPDIRFIPYKDFGIVGKSFIVSKKSK